MNQFNITKITNLDLLKYGGGTNIVNSYNIDNLFREYDMMYDEIFKKFQLTIDRPNDENAIKDPEMVFNYIRDLQNKIDEIFLIIRRMSKDKIKEFTKQFGKNVYIEKIYDLYQNGVIILTNLGLEEFQINYLESYYRIIRNYFRDISRIFKKAHIIIDEE